MKAKTAKRYNPKGRKPTRSQMRRNRSSHKGAFRYPGVPAEVDPLDAEVTAALDEIRQDPKYIEVKRINGMKTGDLRREASQRGLAGAWRKNVVELREYLISLTNDPAGE